MAEHSVVLEHETRGPTLYQGLCNECGWQGKECTKHEAAQNDSDRHDEKNHPFDER